MTGSSSSFDSSERVAAVRSPGEAPPSEPQPESSRSALEQAELARPLRDRAVVRLLLTTGLAPGDVVALDVG